MFRSYVVFGLGVGAFALKAMNTTTGAPVYQGDTMTTIDMLINHLDGWLAAQPAHLVTLGSAFMFTAGLWTIGHQLGAL